METCSLSSFEQGLRPQPFAAAAVERRGVRDWPRAPSHSEPGWGLGVALRRAGTSEPAKDRRDEPPRKVRRVALSGA